MQRTPDRYICPITMDIMTEPVTLDEDGQSYERAALVNWLKQHNTSPFTKKPLKNSTYTPNVALKSLIDDYLLEKDNFFSFKVHSGRMRTIECQNRPQITIQICLVGNSSVGKTSLLYCLEHGQLPENLKQTVPTIGVHSQLFYLDRFFQNEYVVNVHVQDTAGQEKYHSIVPLYFRNANGILLVADVGDLNTIERLQTYWLNQIRSTNFKSHELILICNKLDQFENYTDEYRNKFLDQANKFSLENQIPMFCTSAYRGDNVQEAFKVLILRILKNSDILSNIIANMAIQQHKPKKLKCCFLK